MADEDFRAFLGEGAVCPRSQGQLPTQGHRSCTSSASHTGVRRALGDAARRRNGAEGNVQVDQLANKCLFLALPLQALTVS